MPNLYVLIGPPGAGKSTWARENVGNWAVRINRDEMRSMMAGRYKYGIVSLENMITKISRDIAVEAFKEGKDVILDNTNCNVKTIQSILDDLDPGITVKWVTFELSYRKQRWRIFKRWILGKGPWIGSEVSRRMTTGYNEVIKFLEERFKSMEKR